MKLIDILSGLPTPILGLGALVLFPVYVIPLCIYLASHELGRIVKELLK